MNPSTTPATQPFAHSRLATRARRTLTAGLVAALAVGAFAGCASGDQTGQASTGPTSSPAGTPAGTSEAGAVRVDITIANGQVTPNGQKIDVQRGQTVLLTVTSDRDDEIHAHTGGDGYELEVNSGQQTRGQFVASDVGSFEIESHSLGKIIVVLNVR